MKSPLHLYRSISPLRGDVSVSVSFTVNSFSTRCDHVAVSLPAQGDSATWSHLVLAVGLKPFNVTKLTYGLFRVRKEHGKQPFCFYVRPPRGTTEAEPWEPETQVCGREPPPAAGFPS